MRILFIMLMMCLVPALWAQDVEEDTTVTERPKVAYEATLKLPGGLTILYNGARASKILPCGCKGRNLGGLDKEEAITKAIQKSTSPVISIDAGGFLQEFMIAETRLQAWYLMTAMSRMDLKAVNVGFTDLRQGVDVLQGLQKKFGLPLISANIVDVHTRKPFFDTHKIVTAQLPNGQTIKIGIIGVSAVSGVQSNPIQGDSSDQPVKKLSASWVVPDLGGQAPATATGGENEAIRFASEQTTAALGEGSYDFLDEAQAILPIAEQLRNECELMILLAYSGLARSKMIAEAVPLFDIVISGDAYSRYDPQRAGPNNTILLTGAEHDGRYLGKIEVAFESDGIVKDSTAELIPVDQHYIPDPQTSKLLQDFERDKKKLPPPRSRPLEKIYAGANRCNSCHAGEFGQWKATLHSTAMKTLVEKNVQEKLECVRCHVTGYERPGGFSHVNVTGSLGGVQCESCHGPGQKHIDEERLRARGGEAATVSRSNRMIKRIPERVCIECHDEQNDPDFNYARDIRLVDHTTTPTRATRATVNQSH